MELSGKPSKSLENFIRKIAKIVYNEFSHERGIPRVYEKQFAFKWRSRLITAFKKTMANRSINHFAKIRNNHGQRRSKIPTVYDDIYV